MKILTLYSPADSGLLRLWERSWREKGWTPGIISPKEIQNHPSLRAAVKARGGRFFCSARLINYDLRRPRKTPARLTPVKYGGKGWQTAKLVLYPEGFTEAQILNCR